MADIAGQYLERGTLLSRYEIGEKLGAGGFGITYKAFDTQLHCEVAIKEYLPAEFAIRGSDRCSVTARSNETAEPFQHGLTRFLDEARVLAKFKNRHIVRVSDFMEANGTAYLVMDYEDGQPLTKLLKQRGGSLAETEIKNISIPILDGLKTVHDAGLLHRDIKPDNIYLRRDGPPVLLDFGAARQYTSNQTRGVTTIVTPGYAPFEQYQPHGELGAWTDLYALGATLYHCIWGEPPIDAVSRYAGATVDPSPPAVEVGGDRYSEVLLQTIDWMLRRQFDERPQSVDEVLPCIQGRAKPPVPQRAVDLQPVAQPHAPNAATAADPGATTIRRPPYDPARKDSPRAGPGGNRRIGLMAGAAMAMLIGAGAIWWYVEDQKKVAEEVARAAQVEVEAAQLAQAEADRKASEEAAQLTQAEADQKAAKEAARLAVAEAERKAAEEAAHLAQAEADQKAAEEAAQQAQADADRKATAEAARLAQAEAERKAAEESALSVEAKQNTSESASGAEDVFEAARKKLQDILAQARAQAERKAAEEAAQQAQAEADRKAAAEAARLAQAEAERKAPEESAQLAQAEADRKAAEEAARLAQAEDKTNTVTSNVDEFVAAMMGVTSPSNSAAEIEASAEKKSGTITQTLADQTSADLTNLLREAEYYLSTSDFVAPEGRNARTAYAKVLAVDANNQTALAGMNRIGMVYESAARIMLDEGRPNVSRRVIERGLDAVPEHVGLLRLQARLQTQ